VKDIARMVRDAVGENVKVKFSPTDDARSYHISSERIKKEIGFKARHSVEEAIRDLVRAFRDGRILDPLNDIRYYNIKTMLAKKLK
ncbi:MAG: SDR family NAD-dependent epimerase/dehydratase, partial [Candidatus Omnitrophica bacterium]|nr:SDR family NAD-dependent epimerase/dehydratase [Candidatus Omnitrophota bacterium]